ncbi:11332_t:CDS:2 [Dentiscutata erythropus]|uniref:11332_t:CDS:1 n=1 Tax=Dentiscutata erythropus TaxID=1348616 RepID=A0A9N9BJ62_9GLOM|nr:11332_t:CDS:2 [Dentiscutata erythropus]
MLRSIIYGLKRIHDNGHYHGNLHGGNLLISANNAIITDIGLYECERPFCKDPHDLDLATRICNGLRPEIVTNTPEVYLSLMKRCWHQNPEERPNIVELYEKLDSWATAIQHNPTCRTIDSMAIYKSRLLNFRSLHVTR